MIPKIIIKPSFPNIPKEIINTPRPGMKLERGIGRNTKPEKIKVKIPIILSAPAVVIKFKRGRKILSTWRM